MRGAFFRAGLPPPEPTLAGSLQAGLITKGIMAFEWSVWGSAKALNGTDYLGFPVRFPPKEGGKESVFDLYARGEELGKGGAYKIGSQTHSFSPSLRVPPPVGSLLDRFLIGVRSGTRAVFL